MSTLPASWSSLQNLVHFDASHNKLSGNLESVAPGWMSISYISMEDNQLSSTIPAELSVLASLRTLNLASNQLTGSIPEHWVLGPLTSSLQEVDISFNNLTGSLPGIWAPKMGALVSVQLRSNPHLRGTLPQTWGLFPNLEVLQLSRTGLSGPLPGPFALLSNLRQLDLRNNQVSGPLPLAWGFMESVQEILLDYNNITGTLPSAWSTMRSAVSISVANNQLLGSLQSSSSWTAMQKLEELRVDRNAITGTLPTEWSAFQSLRLIDVKNNMVSGGLPSAWPSGNISTSLEKLDLSSNILEGTLSSQWARMGKLTSLRLQRNRLEGTVPLSWTLITGLTELNVTQSQMHEVNVPDAILKHLFRDCPECLAAERSKTTAPPEGGNSTASKGVAGQDSEDDYHAEDYGDVAMPSEQEAPEADAASSEKAAEEEEDQEDDDYLAGADYMLEEGYDDYDYEYYDETVGAEQSLDLDYSKRTSMGSYTPTTASDASATEPSKILYIVLGVMCVLLVLVAAVIVLLLRRRYGCGPLAGHGCSNAPPGGVIQSAPETSTQLHTLLIRHWKRWVGTSASTPRSGAGIMEVNPLQNVPLSSQSVTFKTSDAAPVPPLDLSSLPALRSLEASIANQCPNQMEGSNRSASSMATTVVTSSRGSTTSSLPGMELPLAPRQGRHLRYSSPSLDARDPNQLAVP